METNNHQTEIRLPIQNEEFNKKNPQITICDIDINAWNGCIVLLINLFLVLVGGGLIGAAFALKDPTVLIVIGSIILFIATFILPFGYITVYPNTAIVFVRFGKYIGTIKKSGMFWTNIFNHGTIVSLKSTNLNGEPLNVNDKTGSPIEIAIVVVWKIKDAAKSVLGVENYREFVTVNSESAVRQIALSHPYDKDESDTICLREGHDQINHQLVEELNLRLSKAGIEVEEARITHLCYASIIAAGMLKKQQAEALVAARSKIVQGAVSIVKHTVESLNANDMVTMNDDEKSRLVSNMLVVLCSDSQAQPTINTGS